MAPWPQLCLRLFPFLALCPWANGFTAWGLSFLISQMGIINRVHLTGLGRGLTKVIPVKGLFGSGT